VGSAAVTRIRTKETSGSTDPGPATGCAVGEDTETTSASGRGAVQQDSSILRLTGRTQMLPCRTTRGGGRLWIRTRISTVVLHWLHKVWPTLAITLHCRPHVGLTAVTLHFHTWCGPSANLECRSEMYCKWLTGNAGSKKLPKKCHLGTIAQICRATSVKLRHVSAIGKTC